MSSIAVTSPRPLMRLTLLTTVAAVTLAALFGAAVAVLAVTHPEREPVGVGQPTETSFGLIAVNGIRALTDQHAGHAGGGHFSGPGSIPEGKEALEVSVTLANTTDEQVAYSPDAFVLRLGASDRLGHSEATFFRGSLVPGGVLDGQLTFLVPIDSSTGTLEFADPGRTAPLAIDLGDLSGSNAGHDDGHDHEEG